MSLKVVFIGNPLGGDDGIGPYLFNVLKNNPQLKEIELLELGVIGLDLISYVNEGDSLVIIDAVYINDETKIGNVNIFSESDLKPNLSLVSQHDFGVEETALILRNHVPSLKEIKVIGINVKNIKSFSNELSKELLKKIETIKSKVVNHIVQLNKNIC